MGRRHRLDLDDALRGGLLADQSQDLVAAGGQHDHVTGCLGLEFVHRACLASDRLPAPETIVRRNTRARRGSRETSGASARRLIAGRHGPAVGARRLVDGVEHRLERGPRRPPVNGGTPGTGYSRLADRSRAAPRFLRLRPPVRDEEPEPMLAIAWTMPTSLSSSGTPWMKLRVDLQAADREELQIGEARIAGAEIVDRQLHAQLGQGLQTAQRLLRIPGSGWIRSVPVRATAQAGRLRPGCGRRCRRNRAAGTAGRTR